MLEQHFPAMGTRVVAVGPTIRGLDEVRGLFERVEACCSRFRPESELSRVNAGTGESVPVSTLLAEALQVAGRMRALTGGLVDAGVGAAVRAWGYDRTFAQVQSRDTAPASNVASPAWKIDGCRLHRSPGTLLDLGGVAKGWAADLAVEAGLASVVSAGGDVRSADPRTTVEVRGIEDRVAARLHLGVGALATSSTLRRRWAVGESFAHHIVDPRTLAPASSPVLSATALAGTVAEAEAGAKAIVLLGAEGLAWADAQAWLNGAVVVWHDGSVFATTRTEVAA